LELRVCRASAVVLQRVPAASADWFMQWQRGIAAAAEGFAGYRGTDVYPPADSQRDEWVVVIHFEDEKSMGEWLGSPVRAQWVEKLQAQSRHFELKALPGGFGPWFAGLARGPDEPAPPSWKMALTVLLGLYPTVMLLTLFPGPYTQRLGLAVAMLIGNALSVSILQWAVMPVLTGRRLLGPWLEANSAQQRVFSLGGLLLILGLLACLTLLFRSVTGLTAREPIQDGMLINPVAPALANALADATGIRFTDLPLAPDRIYRAIFEKHTPRQGRAASIAARLTGMRREVRAAQPAESAQIAAQGRLARASY
jgi:antibiotic biosynthesis monooxygenase (ABM) superfamily enzyme